MSAIVGKRVTQQDSPDAPKLPARTKATSSFMYMHHPHRWQYIPAVGEWLPQLGKLKIDPGVGGVTDEGGTDLAVAQHTRRGWQMIRPSDERLGKFRWYVQKIPKAGRGVVHADATESVEVVGGRAFWQEGGEAFYDFLRHLIGSGIIAPMSSQVVRLKVEQQRQTVDRMESAVANAPHNQILGARLANAHKMLDRMENGDPVAMPPTVDTKPKSKRRKSMDMT
ncbi:hypothetical protein CMI37_06285 [Candidatus Pacearchaeota archaeon]|nr:hypothetical protein [Candidatus Pacearchaeota archaeon]